MRSNNLPTTGHDKKQPRRTRADQKLDPVDVLRFIVRYIEEHDRPPSTREVADFHRVSHSVGRDKLAKLVAQGLITRTQKTARGIHVTEAGHQLVRQLVERTV